MRTLAFTDRTLMLDDAGNLLPIRQWPQALRDCVEGVEIVTRHHEGRDGHTDRLVKVRMSSKRDASREVAKVEGRYPRSKDTTKEDEETKRELILSIVLRGRDRWARAIKHQPKAIEGKTV